LPRPPRADHPDLSVRRPPIGIIAVRTAHSSSKFNKRTCLATLTSSGNYRITGGTGRYRHVRGHGHYQLTAYAIVAKVDGTCGTKVVPCA
jgi:hypothetical protein